MKLNPDCVRDVLIYLEENLIIYRGEYNRIMRNEIKWRQLYEDETLNKKYLIEDIQYTILCLGEARMIVNEDRPGGENRGIIGLDIQDITWAGHELLANLRGEKLWEETKTIADSLGTFSIKALSTIASAIMNAKINQHFQGGVS